MSISSLLALFSVILLIMLVGVVLFLLALLSHRNGSVRVNPKVWERKIRTKQKLKEKPLWKKKP